MLPMLPFDGGHVAVAVYEWIRTKKGQPYYRADITKLFPVVAVFLAFLAVFVVSALFLDITHPLQNLFHLIGPMELSPSLLSPRRPTRRIMLGGVPSAAARPSPCSR